MIIINILYRSLFKKKFSINIEIHIIKGIGLFPRHEPFGTILQCTAKINTVHRS